MHEYRGAKLDETVPGAQPNIKCAFCDRKFATSGAVIMHERSRHKKMLRRRISGEPWPATEQEAIMDSQRRTEADQWQSS